MSTTAEQRFLVILVPAGERLLTPTLLDRLDRSTSLYGPRTVITVCCDGVESTDTVIARRKRELGFAPAPGPGRRDEVRFYQRVLADELRFRDAEVVEACVTFIERDTMGHQYGRARARMCRCLKQCPLTADQSARLVDAILGRFVDGRFGQQFPDHLRLVYRLDAPRLFAVAARCATSPRAYVRRIAASVLRWRAITP